MSRRGALANPRVRNVVKRALGEKRKSWFWGALFDLVEGTYRAAGMQFEIPSDLTARSFRARFFWDFYEPQERALVARYVRGSDCVLELGGCLGVVTCITNRQLLDPRRHVVVEANPRLIPVLRRNRDRNGCRFEVAHAIVSTSSDGTFFIYRDVLEGSMQQSADAGPDVVRARVPVTTVEQLESTHGLAFNAVIMDIEGGELAFLREHQPFLGRVDLLIIEFHPSILGSGGYAAAQKILTDLGLEKIDAMSNSEAWARRHRLSAEPGA
jgi:FkbM family methyltransferase